MIIDIQKRGEELEKKKYTTIAKEFSISTLSAKKYVCMNEEVILKIQTKSNCC